jgi:dTDP-4-amino-4,6-dideoxygalactose transaminase
MLRLSLPNIDEAAIRAAVEVLRSGQLVYGTKGVAFERELERWLGCRHAIVVSSGTAALHLALIALEIGPGDAVLVPDFTFPATANVVLLAGARPVVVDVDEGSYCVTPQSLNMAIASWRGPERIRALIPVHEFGHPVQMTAVRDLAQHHELLIVEDAACAIGATVGDAKVGTLGDIGCFSLHPRKTLTTGEGGILTTNDDALAQRLRRLRNHGMERRIEVVEFQEPGLNYRLTDFQSALGLAQLPHLESWIKTRRTLALRYLAALAPLQREGLLALPAAETGHSWQTFMVVLADGIDRTAVMQSLADADIETNLGAQCISEQPAFRALRGTLGAASNSQRLYRQGLALPFCEQYGQREVEHVVAALRRVLSEGLWTNS